MIVTSSFAPFIPVLKLLEGEPLLTLNTEFATQLQNLDLPGRPLAEFATGGLKDQSFIDSVKILQAVASPFSQDGLSAGPLDFMTQYLPAYLYPRLTDLCLLVLTLDEVKPKLILLHNDVEPLTRASALWAKANGVPCLHIPHAIYQDINRTPIGTDIHDLITATYLGVSGTTQRDWYEERGFPRENIRETGLPQFDKWGKYADWERDKTAGILKLDPKRPIITYVGTWAQNTNMLGNTNEWQVLYIEFLKAAIGLPDCQFIIKIHPNGGQQNFDWHVQQAKEAGLKCLVTPSHLEACLYASDLVFAPYGSNVLIEGTFVPHLRLMTTHGFENDKAVIKVGMGAEEISEAIQVSLSQSPADTREMKHKYMGAADGKAAERIVEWIGELCPGE